MSLPADPRDPRLPDRRAAQEDARLTLARLDMMDDMLERETSSRRNAWTAAFILFVICAAQAAALALLLPLKEVQPYTILVDRTTGYVETIRGLKVGDAPADVALTESFLAQYVLARETVDGTDLKARYERVALWSDGEAREDYVAFHRAGNPEGLLAQFQPDDRVRVIVKAIEIQPPDAAAVRFDALTRRAGVGAETVESFRSVIGFRYSGAPMRNRDRLINPLGFQVLRYRRDPEGLTAPSEPVASTPPLAIELSQPEVEPAPAPAPPARPRPTAKAQAAPAPVAPPPPAQAGPEP